MTRQFLISDTHFFHEKIIEVGRPFKNAEQMNARLVKNWNRVVNPGDIVFHLGDFGFGSLSSLTEVFRKLRGQKILVRGNHDKFTLTQYYGMGWAAVLDAVELKHMAKIKLRHIPYTNQFPDSDYVIHGHIHSLDAEDVRNIIHPHQHLNVCVEHINYTPILLESALKRLRKRCQTA